MMINHGMIFHVVDIQWFIIINFSNFCNGCFWETKSKPLESFSGTLLSDKPIRGKMHGHTVYINGHTCILTLRIGTFCFCPLVSIPCHHTRTIYF